MREILRSNNSVLVGFVEALLRDASLECFVADRNMSVAEGSIGAFPTRVLVPDEHFAQALRVLREAGLGDEIFDPRSTGI